MTSPQCPKIEKIFIQMPPPQTAEKDTMQLLIKREYQENKKYKSDNCQINH